jgi:hypothetical protein
MAPAADGTDLEAELRAVLFQPYQTRNANRSAGDAADGPAGMEVGPDDSAEPIALPRLPRSRFRLWVGVVGGAVTIGVLSTLTAFGLAASPGTDSDSAQKASTTVGNVVDPWNAVAAGAQPVPGASATSTISAGAGRSGSAGKPGKLPAGSGPGSAGSAKSTTSKGSSNGSPAIADGSVKLAGTTTAGDSPSGAGAKSVPTVIRTGVQGSGDFPSGATVTMRSPSSGKYVRAETGYSGTAAGMLRVASTEASAGKFTLIWNESLNGWSLVAKSNGRYVSAEVQDPDADNGMMRARASSASDWETFTMYRSSNGQYSFYSPVSGKYVTAEMGYSNERYGMLRARSSQVDDWERFVLAS